MSRRLVPLRALLSAALLPLFIAGCACQGEKNPGELCDQMAETSRKRMSGSERSKCIRAISEQFLSDEQAYSCFATCVDKASAKKGIDRCFTKCQAVGGVARLQTQIDKEKYVGGAVITVKTKPGAKVSVELTPSSGKVKETLPKKAAKRSKKAKKSGKAVFAYKTLAKGSYNIKITSTHKGSTKKKVERLSISSSAVAFEGTSSSGTDRGCTLELSSPGREKIKPTKPVKASGDALEVRFVLADGTSGEVGGKKLSFKKGEATVALSLGAMQKGMTALNAISAFPRAKAPVTLKSKGGTWEGELACGAPSLKKKVTAYKGGEPLSFPGDSGRGKGAILIAGSVPSIVGDQKATLSDIDFVAVKDLKRRKAGNCPYYDPNTKGRVNVKRVAVDDTVTLYERRTGKKIAKKSFRARKKGCPKTRSPGSSRTITSYASSADVKRWLKEKAR